MPVAYWADALTIEHLLAVAFVVGTFTVLFDVAMSGYFPRVVPREHIVEAQGHFGATRSLSYIAGPSVSGFLVQALTAPVAVLADAVSFLVSGAFIARIRATEPPPEPGEPETIRARLASGFRFTLGHPILRAAIGCTSVVNFFNLGFGAIVVLYLARDLELEAGLIGVIFGAGAVGALLGSLIAARVGRRIGIGPAIIVGSLLFPLSLLAFPFAGGPKPLVVALLILGEFVAGLGVMLFDVNQNSLIVLVTPDRMRPRQMATMRFFVYGVRPLGALAGGLFGEALGLRGALFLTTTASALGVSLPARVPGTDAPGAARRPGLTAVASPAVEARGIHHLGVAVEDLDEALDTLPAPLRCGARAPRALVRTRGSRRCRCWSARGASS